MRTRGKDRPPCREFSLAALILVVVMMGTAAAGSERYEPRVSIHKERGVIHIETSLWVDHPPEEVWPVLLDYDGLASYMPNVDSSRVIHRNSSRVLVRQVGSTRFIFKKTLRFILAFRRLDAERVSFRQVQGDFEQFLGTWSVRPVEGGSLIGYVARIRQSMGLPGFLVNHVIKRDVQRMMPAIAEELDRRHGTLEGESSP